MHFLTCVSFIVADESFGEEPDDESCRPEKRKERGLALAQEVRLSPSRNPHPKQQLSGKASHQVKPPPCSAPDTTARGQEAL